VAAARPVTGWTMQPAVGSQVSMVQGSASSHASGAPPHTPAWHVSFDVQRLPSLQAVPSASFGLEQMPVVGSQTPATWH